MPGASSGPESAHQSGVSKGDRSTHSQEAKKSSGSLFQSASSTPRAPPEQDTSLDITGAGACAFPQEQYEQVSDDDLDRSASGSGSEDGHFSDVADPPEQTEDMSYRETVRSVRAVLGKVLTYKNLIYLLNFPISFTGQCDGGCQHQKKTSFAVHCNTHS